LFYRAPSKKKLEQENEERKRQLQLQAEKEIEQQKRAELKRKEHYAQELQEIEELKYKIDRKSMI